jgi:hypothetical protein
MGMERLDGLRGGRPSASRIARRAERGVRGPRSLTLAAERRYPLGIMRLRLTLNEDARRSNAPSRTRRIWEIDPVTLGLVTGVLLRREDVETILDQIVVGCAEGVREDALRVRMLVGCTTPCALAEAVEGVLDRQTQVFRAAVERSPMMQIADWWSRERDRMSGEQIAALLWRLACAPRPHLDRLVSRVSGDLCVRAMQLLREEASPVAEGSKGMASVPYEVSRAAVA